MLGWWSVSEDKSHTVRKKILVVKNFGDWTLFAELVKNFGNGPCCRFGKKSFGGWTQSWQEKL